MEFYLPLLFYFYYIKKYTSLYLNPRSKIWEWDKTLAE